jgi:hypothetical protein
MSIPSSENNILVIEPEEISTVPAGKYVDPVVLRHLDDCKEQGSLNNAEGERPERGPTPLRINKDTRFADLRFGPGGGFGEPLMGTLSRALHGDWDAAYPAHFYRIFGIETSYYVKYVLTSNPPNPEDVVEHIRCLVEYLESAEGNFLVVDFVRFMRDKSGWTRDGEVGMQ